MGLMDMIDAFTSTVGAVDFECPKCNGKGGKLTIACQCGYTKDFCLGCVAMAGMKAARPLIDEISSHEKVCKLLQAQANAAARSQLGEVDDQ